MLPLTPTLGLIDQESVLPLRKAHSHNPTTPGRRIAEDPIMFEARHTSSAKHLLRLDTSRVDDGVSHLHSHAGKAAEACHAALVRAGFRH